MGSQTRKDIEILLTKYLEKSCSPDEKKHFFELLSLSDNERSLKEIIYLYLIDFNEDEYKNHVVDSGRIYNQIISEINGQEIRDSEIHRIKRKARRRQLLVQGLSLAAVFCFAFFLGGIIKPKVGKISFEQAVAVAYSEIKAPFGTRSEIKLSDGTQVTLNAGSVLKYSSNYNLNNR